MSALPDHHCPGCGARLAANPRYPWHFCPACTARATDGAGRGLVFANAGLSGGFTFGYRDRPGAAPAVCSGVLALIAGRPARVGEARFGGIVAEPVDGGARPRPGEIDLRGERRHEPGGPAPERRRPGRGGPSGAL